MTLLECMQSRFGKFDADTKVIGTSMLIRLLPNQGVSQ